MKVAAIQMTSTANLDANLRQAETLMREAAAAGATLLLLPENFACYGGDYRSLAASQGQALDAWMAYWARELGVFLAAGSVPRLLRPEGTPVPEPRVRTALLVFDPQGQRIARYDKLHLFDMDVADAQGSYRESAVFEAGRSLETVTIAGWQVGLAICYDLRFPAQARALAQAGASLLLYPSAFTQVTGRAHWHMLVRARAVENGCYVLAANQCGEHNSKRRSYGHSLLVDPWGEIVAELDDQPGVLVAEVSEARVSRIRQAMPLHDHQRFTVNLDD